MSNLSYSFFLQKQRFEYLFYLFDKDWSDSINQEDVSYAFEKLIDNASGADKDRLLRASEQWFFSFWAFASLIEGGRNHEISKENWMKWAKWLKDDLSNRGDASKIFTDWRDAVYDGIGGGDAISAAEYAAWWASFEIKGDAAANFKKLDTNGDGEITKDEFTALLKEFITGDSPATGRFFFGDPDNSRW